MSEPTGAPASVPCGSCPYRTDTPSGLWAAVEYDKLPTYDDPGNLGGAFFCHQQDGRLCAGWVACHDMDNSIPLRLAVAFGTLSVEAAQAARDYTTDVPVFASGKEAAEHGKARIKNPPAKARTMAGRIADKRDDLRWVAPDEDES